MRGQSCSSVDALKTSPPFLSAAVLQEDMDANEVDTIISEMVSGLNSVPFTNNNINWNKSILITSPEKYDMKINAVIDTLINLNVNVNDLTRIGNIQSKHILLLQFNSESPVKRLMELKTISVAGRSVYCCKPLDSIDIWITDTDPQHWGQG